MNVRVTIIREYSYHALEGRLNESLKEIDGTLRDIKLNNFEDDNDTIYTAMVIYEEAV